MLDTSPRSVQEARRWVGEACRLLGREDLLDSAQLGISELVTNALLHGDPPIGVRLRGTAVHPRVEVLDGSVKPPLPNPKMTDDDELLATFGRGLGLVAMCSTTWGAYVLDDGKIVWFEPAAEPNPDAVVTDGQVYESTSAATGRTPRMSASGGVSVHFASLPLGVFVDWRRHFRDIRRELVLLSLTHSSAYPVASTLSDLFMQFETELRQTNGLQDVDAAIEAGAETAKVTLVVGPEAPELLAKMSEVLELADAFCRNEQLLSLATTPIQLEFQQWFLGEFARQCDGEPPRPWTGPLTVASPSHGIL